MISWVSESFMGPILRVGDGDCGAVTTATPLRPKAGGALAVTRGSGRGRLIRVGGPFAAPCAINPAQERDPVQERVRLVDHLLDIEHDPNRLLLGAALGAGDRGPRDRRRVGEPVPDLA